MVKLLYLGDSDRMVYMQVLELLRKKQTNHSYLAISHPETLPAHT